MISGVSYSKCLPYFASAQLGICHLHKIKHDIEASEKANNKSRIMHSILVRYKEGLREKKIHLKSC